MTIRLRQSTASQEVPLGVFVDSTDGNTAETALTIANTDIKLWKVGATTLASKASGGATHISGGIYYAVLDATDTDTLGPLVLFVHVAGALPVRLECEVLSAVVYDSLIAGTDNLQVDAVQISGDSTAADNLETAFDDTAGSVPWMGVIDQGTAQAATSTTLQLRAAAGFADDELIGAILVITGGVGVGQSRLITDYASATDTATVDAWTTTPSGTITYKVVACPPNLATPADVNVATIDAAAVTSIQTGLATSAELATTDAVADAIKAKTDSLTFTVAGKVDANITHVIADPVVAGSAKATNWGGTA